MRRQCKMARLNLVCAKVVPCDKTELLVVSEEGEEHREKKNGKKRGDFVQNEHDSRTSGLY